MYHRMESSDYQLVSLEDNSQNDTMILLYEEKTLREERRNVKDWQNQKEKFHISETFTIFEEKHKEMKMISFDDFQDKYIGKIGTPQRDTLEKLVKEAVQHHLLDSF